MGGRGRSRTQRRPKSDPSPDNKNNNEHDKPNWQPFATQNPAFDEYYKEQGIVSPEEWDSFMEVLRKPWPAAFRINSRHPITVRENEFMKSLQAEVSRMMRSLIDGETEAIRPLRPWYVP